MDVETAYLEDGELKIWVEEEDRTTDLEVIVGLEVDIE